MSHVIAQTGPRMPRSFPRAPRAQPAQAPSASWPTLAGVWHRLVTALRRAIAAANEPDIDDATLRDLGMSRSELPSFRAEAEGRAEATRLRVLMEGTRN